eukprot:Phypoly_transcript_11316.p1 GENE.Phypoly_transcript_11316~~Phypoly_transcript_11316.p1  ORF type:complete len:275 (+),score=29.02 Phypoly_transcript_11316:206-1030(+)
MAIGEHGRTQELLPLPGDDYATVNVQYSERDDLLYVTDMIGKFIIIYDVLSGDNSSVQLEYPVATICVENSTGTVYGIRKWRSENGYVGVMAVEVNTKNGSLTNLTSPYFITSVNPGLPYQCVVIEDEKSTSIVWMYSYPSNPSMNYYDLYQTTLNTNSTILILEGVGNMGIVYDPPSKIFYYSSGNGQQDVGNFTIVDGKAKFGQPLFTNARDWFITLNPSIDAITTVDPYIGSNFYEFFISNLTTKTTSIKWQTPPAIVSTPAVWVDQIKIK